MLNFTSVYNTRIPEDILTCDLWNLSANFEGYKKIDFATNRKENLDKTMRKDSVEVLTM